MRRVPRFPALNSSTRKFVGIEPASDMAAFLSWLSRLLQGRGLAGPRQPASATATRHDMTLSDPALDDFAEAGTPSVAELRPTLPRVSVIVVNYNYGRFLAQAIGSVFAQPYPHVECLLVDNGSPDASAAVSAA